MLSLASDRGPWPPDSTSSLQLESILTSIRPSAQVLIISKRPRLESPPEPKAMTVFPIHFHDQTNGRPRRAFHQLRIPGDHFHKFFGDEKDHGLLSTSAKPLLCQQCKSHNRSTVCQCSPGPHSPCRSFSTLVSSYSAAYIWVFTSVSLPKTSLKCWTQAVLASLWPG